MKRMVLIIGLICSVLLCSCGANIAVSPVEDFEYEMVDGEIVITDYIGTDLEIHVPKEINDRPVTVIGEDAFKGYDMTCIVLPDSVKHIEESAFQDCVCLEEAQLGDGVESISSYAFYNCESLIKIEFSDNLTQIWESAFANCTALEKISLPNSLSRLAKESFKGCTSLSELELPDEVDANIKAAPKAMSALYYSFDWLVMPTAFHQAESGTMFSALQSSAKPTTVMVVSKNSLALKQLQEAEKCFGIDLQELGYYRIK